MLLLLIALAIGPCAARVLPQVVGQRVEHSLDGGRTFVPAGTIQGQAEGLELVREPSEAQQAQLASLVESDSFYVVRVPTGAPGRYASASVRTACLTASPASEQLSLSLDDAGSVLSLGYALEGVHSGSCKAGGAAPSVPVRSVVSVQQPAEGPSVLAPGSVADLGGAGLFPGSGGAPPSSSSRQASSGGPTGRPRGVPTQAGSEAAATGDGAAEGEQAPAPEEKTWLQKNWLVVMGVSMAVFNLLGNLAKQQQQPAAGAAAATAGGARRARGGAA